MTDPEIIDLLERALDCHQKNLPESAAVEELTATRMINRKILELQVNQKKRR